MPFLLFILTFFLSGANASEPGLKDLHSPPPRIIRSCCAFGSDLHLVGIPFAKINQLTSIEKLGTHHYLGNSSEGVGLIYTQRGGFIDVGHLRDQADWTKYLYTFILENRQSDVVQQKLGYEGGTKNLIFTGLSGLDSADCLLLAGKIAYDLSLWHELSTWFGASLVPLMPERYSSLSIEDAYSNLLGIEIGIAALQSSLPYNEAVTSVLFDKLLELGAVQTEEDTEEALEAVRNIWWSNDKRLPSSKVLLERDTEVYSRVRPWILPGAIFSNVEPEVLYVPYLTSNKHLLTDYYELDIELNYKFPVKEIFPGRDSRLITQNDFDMMLTHIAMELKSTTQNSRQAKTFQQSSISSNLTGLSESQDGSDIPAVH